MLIEINISTCVFLSRSGGGLRTGASCSWNLEKRCNRLSMKVHPTCSFILDANEGYKTEEAVEVLEKLHGKT